MHHIYADDTQLYCTFDADSSSDALACAEACVRDIRSWMIANLCDLMKPYVPGRSGLRSENQYQLERTVSNLKSYGDRSFQFGAINEWHNRYLPQNIRESNSLKIFKNNLKTHLLYSQQLHKYIL